MLRFFRKIRLQHLSANRFASYLLYALGEILLVVVGILIALKINNWNEDRQNEAKNRTMLQQLRDENLRNLEVLQEDVVTRKARLQSITDFIFFLKSDSLPEYGDRAASYLRDLSVSESYSFSQNYLISYINSNPRVHTVLTSELVRLNTNQKDLEFISQKALDIRLEDFFGYLAPEVDFMGPEIKAYELLTSLKFRNNVVLMRAVEAEVSQQFQRTLNQQKTVDSLITQYLQTTD